MTETFTFRKEVLKKYDLDTYNLFMEAFDSMPIAAVVGDKYLAVHGGISPSLNVIQQIDTEINRFQEVPFEGLFCDIVWSDPVADEECSLIEDFSSNTDRDCSVYFGQKAVKKVLEKNDLRSILRGH